MHINSTVEVTCHLHMATFDILGIKLHIFKNQLRAWVRAEIGGLGAIPLCQYLLQLFCMHHCMLLWIKCYLNFIWAKMFELNGSKMLQQPIRMQGGALTLCP